MIVYHTTDAAKAILDTGFRDGSGSYGVPTWTLTGVFVADEPVGVNEGATGEEVLEIQLPGRPEDYASYAIEEEGLRAFQEWCIPAAIINAQGATRLLTEAEVDAIEDELFYRRHPRLRPKV